MGVLLRVAVGALLLGMMATTTGTTAESRAHQKARMEVKRKYLEDAHSFLEIYAREMNEARARILKETEADDSTEDRDSDKKEDAKDSMEAAMEDAQKEDEEFLDGLEDAMDEECEEGEKGCVEDGAEGDEERDVYQKKQLERFEQIEDRIFQDQEDTQEIQELFLNDMGGGCGGCDDCRKQYDGLEKENQQIRWAEKNRIAVDFIQSFGDQLTDAFKDSVKAMGKMLKDENKNCVPA